MTDRSITVLVVEDEPDLRDAILELVREAGHQPVGVADLAAARDALNGAGVDLVLLDVIINGATSEPLLSELALRAVRPPVVLTSADSSPRSRALADQYALPLLLKPFDADELLSLVRAHAR